MFRDCFIACAIGLLVAVVVIAGPAPAAAQDGIGIELNRAEDVDDGCRITTVFTNGFDVRIRRLVVEVAIFDREGEVVELFLLPSRPLSPGRSSVRRFGLGDTPCGEIGQMLFNHVTVCEGEGLDPDLCSQAVTLSSRAEVPLVATIGGAAN